MDKRKQANELVKKRMIDALIDLIKEKNTSSITISELIKKAGVARASFYRNYNTIEDIIYEVIDLMKNQSHWKWRIFITIILCFIYFNSMRNILILC